MIGLFSVERVLLVEIREDRRDLLNVRLSRLLYKSDCLLAIEEVSYWLCLSKHRWNLSLATKRLPAFKQLLPQAANTPELVRLTSQFKTT